MKRIESTIKGIIKLFVPLVPQNVLNLMIRQLGRRQFEKWQKDGCPVPPPHLVKQNTIGEYQQKYGLTTFVETGTYLGDMVEAQKARFKKIYSIELSFDLFKKAKRRFVHDKNVTIIQGDSGKVISKIIQDINEPAIFWLDAHYSSGITAKGDKECPIFEELNAILNNTGTNHILLIDDARLFNGQSDYPTLEKLTDYIVGRNSKYQVEVKHDIIRYVV